MGECMLIHVVPLLSNNQKFLLAGSGDGADRDDVWCVKGDGIEYKEPEFKMQKKQTHAYGCMLPNLQGKIFSFSHQIQMFTILLGYHKAAT